METNDELESFRRQWLEEVASRSKPSQIPQSERQISQTRPGEGDSSRHDPPPPQYTVSHQREDVDDSGEQTSAPLDFDGVTKGVRSMSIGPDVEDSTEPLSKPTSALEHFEQAVSKEDQGILGDSLDLYRKAYRLDSKVDQTYRKKHFPPSTTQVPRPNPSNAPVTTVPNPAHHSSADDGDVTALSTAELIASFSVLPISAAEPIIENTPPPPCPISNVPSEVLAAILQQLALLDPASLVRVALACKRLAYHVSHEQHIWRRLCQGPEFGFSSMHYSFPCDIKGNRIYCLKPRYTPFPLQFTRKLQVPKPFLSWKQVFQAFPRIRFTGIYISTVNYTRPGTTSAFQTSWNAPIHIVTYYRYLRFYPDGSLISLVSTTKPVDVVPHISEESLDIVKTGGPAAQKQQQQQHHHHHHHQRHGPESAAPQPLANPVPPTAAATLKNSLRGRWHLAKPLSAETEESSEPNQTSSAAAAPSSSRHPNQTASNNKPHSTASTPTPDPHDVFVETEGVDAKYTYTMHLSLRSSGTSSAPHTSKNTKLAWKGFWCYNHLTDDWAEFGLRNDRAFVFRRVRGWGMG